jgi:hypothetical protein
MSARLTLIATVAQTVGIVSLLVSQYLESLNSGREPYEHHKDPVDWWATPWGQLVRGDRVQDPNSYEGRTFRCRFRLPFRLYQFLVVICKAHKVFGEEKSASGVPAMPVELKVLGALRTLGRATLHDDVAELSGADKETHRKAFLLFINFVSSFMREEWIKIPEGEELEQVLKEYSMLGFPGAVGSMDATHLHWMRCPAGARNQHVGKEHFPSRVFNVAVTHHGKIFAVSEGHPGGRNDKALVRYDSLVNQMRFEGLFSDIEFVLHDRAGVPTTHKGGYLITDNGYHFWRVFTAPFKVMFLAIAACLPPSLPNYTNFSIHTLLPPIVGKLRRSGHSVESLA